MIRKIAIALLLTFSATAIAHASDNVQVIGNNNKVEIVNVTQQVVQPRRQVEAPQSYSEDNGDPCARQQVEYIPPPPPPATFICVTPYGNYQLSAAEYPNSPCGVRLNGGIAYGRVAILR